MEHGTIKATYVTQALNIFFNIDLSIPHPSRFRTVLTFVLS